MLLLQVQKKKKKKILEDLLSYWLNGKYEKACDKVLAKAAPLILSTPIYLASSETAFLMKGRLHFRDRFNLGKELTEDQAKDFNVP